jgi:hypothetical protein
MAMVTELQPPDSDSPFGSYAPGGSSDSTRLNSRAADDAAQACVWNAASAGPCVRYHGNRCDLNEVAAPDGFRLQLAAMLRMYPAPALTRWRRDVRVRPR